MIFSTGYEKELNRVCVARIITRTCLEVFSPLKRHLEVCCLKTTNGLITVRQKVFKGSS